MKQKCLKIGITGGIGSGKTTICKLFEQLGVKVYYADDEAKRLMQSDHALISAIKAAFGEAAYTKEGQLDRAYLAAQIFTDPTKRSALNAIVHPAVLRHGQVWHEEACASGQTPYTLKEAALLIESGSYRELDYLILVTAPKRLRIKRVMARDRTTKGEVERRIASQLDDRARKPYAQFVIKNDGKHALIPQVWALHQAILKLLPG